MPPGRKRSRNASAAEIDEIFGAKDAHHQPAVITPAVLPVSEDEIHEFMKTNQIRMHDPSAPPPCITLRGAPFPKLLVDVLMKQGFQAPSAVQACAWPVAMAGRDVLAVAKTGSGKTLGYLLPAIARCHERLSSSASKGEPRCLVMAPTRELVLQIQGVAAKYGAALSCRSVGVYGGSPKWEQAQELQRGCEIIVATPGRLMDLQNLHSSSERGGDGRFPPATSLAHCGMLVLDEADRMLDMGFEHDIRAIVKTMPKRRHVSLFTATWPTAVQRVASELLAKSHVRISIGSSGEKPSANRAVTQVVHVVSPEEKWGAFVRLLVPFRVGGELASKRVLVFANTRVDVAAIGDYCQRKGFSAETLSRDREQADREEVIRRFRSGSVRMLIATDVAARGLDISGIERVINYDYPPGEGGADDYIHRIGRTGRAGAKGQADTLFTPATDSKGALALVRILTDAGQHVPPQLAAMAKRKAKAKAKAEAAEALKAAAAGGHQGKSGGGNAKKRKLEGKATLRTDGRR